MALTTRFTIVTPGAVKFEGDAQIVVAPGAAGDLGALPNHAPLLTTLRAGAVRATTTTAGRVEFAVDGGFMQVMPDRVIILTDLALTRDEINLEQARAELQRAEQALAQKKGADDGAERRAVAWALACVEVARRPAA
ncbi:MAG: ATP synthase F1 subunit epsilon [Candidatus Eremiobacteraeota bacterium]|nr:ATP synthase F1 subunit epsilon [Candidatus Eremiobacteraeota bacterium]